MPTYHLNVNGKVQEVTAEADTPLLYVLRNDLMLNAAKFGCGLEQCGACTIIVGKEAVRCCCFPLSAVHDAPITTLEGLGTIEHPHPLQKAFMDQQAAQCGYCINGMIMTAKVFLDRNPNPTDPEIREAMAHNLCRCGTHNRIVRAIGEAAKAGSAKVTGA
jgi:nicotinate dehydrogenase subunit A